MSCVKYLFIKLYSLQERGSTCALKNYKLFHFWLDKAEHSMQNLHINGGGIKIGGRRAACEGVVWGRIDCSGVHLWLWF